MNAPCIPPALKVSVPCAGAPTRIADSAAPSGSTSLDRRNCGVDGAVAIRVWSSAIEY